MMIVRFTKGIKTHMGSYSFSATVSGLAIGSLYQAPFLRHLIPIALFMMLFPAFLDTDIGSIVKAVTNPKLAATALFLNFTIAPMLMYGLTRFFSFEMMPDLMIGLLVFGMIPGGGMGPAYTGMINGNINLSVAITTGGLLMSIGAVPFWTSIFLGRIITVPAALIIKYLLMIIVMPMICAILTRWLVIRYKGRTSFEGMKMHAHNISGIGLMLMLFVTFALHGRFVMQYPELMMKIILPAVSFSLMLLIGATFLAMACQLYYEDAVAFAISSTVKNTAVSITLTMAVFGGRAALAVAVAGPLVQLPVMLSYMKIRTWMTS